MLYNGCNVNDAAVPLSFEEKDIKCLHRSNPFKESIDKEIYAFMCKRCGSTWKIDQQRCHEPYCVYFLQTS